MKKRSLARALPARLLLCAYVPLLLVTALALALPYRETARQRERECAGAMTLAANRIAQHVSNVSQTVMLLEDSAPLRAALKKHAASDASSLAPGDLYFTVETPISYRGLFSNRAISAITVFSKNRLAYYGLQQTTTDNALTRCGAALYNYAGDIPEGGAYVPPQAPNGYVYYIRQFTDIYDGRELGHLVIELEAVQNYQNNGVEPYTYQVDLSAYPGAQYYVYNASGAILFSNEAALVGTQLSQSLPPALLAGDSVAKEAPGYLLYHETLYKEHLFVTIAIPERAVHTGLGQAPFLLCAGGVALGTLLLIALLSERMTAPLRALAHYCAQTREQTVPPVFDPVWQELAAVQEVLGARDAQLEELRAVVMKNQLKMKDNEIQLLQAQISPHFLFNMLDIIGWQAAKDQNQDVSDMITHLGGLLRNNILLSDRETITIGQEVQYIRDYLALEQIRHAGQFTYSIDAEDDLLREYNIPKLSLQPIVENCIVHGLTGLARPGVIEIRIWDDMDDIVCTVQDNGVGFDAQGYFERAANLPPDPKRSHIALHNIQDRIHMLCGAAYGIQIDSTPGEGTLVTVRFPPA